MSKTTKGNKIASGIFGALSIICNFGLIIGFFIYGMVNGTSGTKYSMALTGIVGIILAVISTVAKKHWRTPLVIILGALYFALTNFAPVLIIVAVAIILDEILFTPLHDYFHTRAVINGQIDKRIEG